MRSNRFLKVVALRVLVACAAAMVWPALAQNENVFRPARGFQPAGSYAVSQLDSINNVTGGVTVRIPLARVSGRNGAGLSLGLIYNSALYNLQTQPADEYRVMDYATSMGTVSLNMLNVSNGGGWRYSHRYSLDIDSRGGSVPGTRVTLVTGDGGSHQLWLRVPVAGQNDTDGYSQFDITGTNINGMHIGPNLTYYTTDGSFIRVEVVVGSTWTAYFPNGDYVSGPIGKDADQVCDRNSNCTHITNTVDPDNLWITTTELADDFGRKVIISYGGDAFSGTDQIRALPANASTSGTWGDPRNQASPLTTSVTWNTISFGHPAAVTAGNATSGVMYQCKTPEGTPSELARDWRCLNSFSHRTVSQIQLPNGLSYDFTYADGGAGAEAGQGELRQMKLPSKLGEAARAEVHYYWSRKERPIIGSVPTPWFDANINPVSQKVLSWQEESDSGATSASNTWTYQFGTTDGNGNFISFADRSIVTAPDGGITTQFFYNRTGAGAWNTGLVYKTTGPAGNTWRCWQSNEPWIGVSATGDSKNPYLRAEYRQLPGAANAAATWLDYDKNGNLITKREYDWVSIPGTDVPSCSVAGTVLRKTENRYWNPPGGALAVAKAADAPTIGLTNAYWNTSAYHKRDSLLETRIYAGEASTAAVSQFQYDNSDTMGNLRYEYRWDSQLPGGAPAVATTAVTLNSGNSAIKERQYNSGFGLLTKEIDPSGNATQYTYGSVENCPAEISNIYPTLVSSPEGRTRQYKYDCATGVVKDEIVTSNRNLTTHNDYDRYGRLTSTVSGYGLVSPNARSITTEYNDQVRQVRSVTDGTLGQVSYFNQLGELFRESENADDSTGAIVAGSTHDIRTVTIQRTVSSAPSYSLTSNPFLSDGSASEPTLGWTLRRTDSAGRTTDIYYYRGSAKPAPFGTNPNSPTHESYSYSGNTTTFTDPQNRTRTTAVDALGRMQTASEGGLSSATYGYDALDNLTSVTMTDSASYAGLPNGGAKTQTRTFVYSSLSRLVSSTNPESGTTTYTYYPDGALHTKTDARNVTVTYTVDGLSRVRKKDYSATTPVTPAARYCYDGEIYDVATDSCIADPTRASDYAQGALTHALTRNGSTIISETKYTGIDAQGRVTSSLQKTSGLANMPFVYQYSATGQLAAVQYPSGRWVSYDINGANRVKAVRSGQTGTSFYLQQAAYKPDGSFAGATVGLDPLNQWAEMRQYNSRLQPCTMQIQKGAQTPLLALQWKHSASDPDGTCEGTGTDNNGNILAERLQYPSAGVQQTVPRSFGYDAANRLSSYSEPTTGKSQSYGYDAFGNLWQSGAATGVPELRPNGPSWYLGSNGQVTNQLSNTAYHAGGYQAQLSLSVGTNATFDAEGRLVQVASGGVVATYDYDAEGRRVKRTDAGGNATYYVHDADGQLMAEYGGAAATVTGVQYIATDQLGSTRMVQDAQGNCGVRMDYAPYGGVVPRTGQDCYVTPWTSGQMFTGALRDGATELDHMEARQYYATLGRFTSPDPENAGADPSSPGSWNMYAYVRNRPLSFVDPDGRECRRLQDGPNGEARFEGDCSSAGDEKVTEGDKPHTETFNDRQGTWLDLFTASNVPRYVPDDTALPDHARNTLTLAYYRTSHDLGCVGLGGLVADASGGVLAVSNDTIDKRFTQGGHPTTSPASEKLRDVFTHKSGRNGRPVSARMGRALPAFERNGLTLKYTPTASPAGFLARWLPVYGLVLAGVSAKETWGCLSTTPSR